MKWPRKKFNELYLIPSRNGLNRPSRVRGEGYRMVNMGELFANERIGNIDMERVQMNERELEHSTLAEGDLLFARQSLVLEGAGKCAYVTEVPEPTTFESHLIRVRLDRTKADSLFYYYLFASPYSGMTTIVQQCAQAGIRGTQLGELPVLYPPPDIQRKISDVLSAYDELIENNRRRIGLLEEAARLLYRDWFVRLRFPGHEHSHIVDGVPQAWQRKPLSELTSFLKRGIAPHYDDDAEGLVINQKCIRDRRLDIELARHQSREFTPERQVQVGDVLVNSTGEGTLGRVAQVTAPIENCTVDTHVTIVRPKPGIPIHYFGMAVMEWEPRFSTMGRGATNQTELSPTAIGDVEIILPSDTLAEQFESSVESIYQQLINLVRQNQKLRYARGLLLPRLMSGEIAV